MTHFEESISQVLIHLQAKEQEYTECSVRSNLNWEYFKGKKDAYAYACKLIKRAMEWNDFKNVIK